MSGRPVCVLGLGLIGGSALRAAHRAGTTVWGAAASERDCAAAAREGYPVEASVEAALVRAASEDALVVLAVPLPAMDEVLPAVARHAPRCRLTDTASVQAPVVEAVCRRAPHARHVGGHPMAGTAGSGWAAGSAGLFDGAAWVVDAGDEVDREVWAEVARLALSCGAHVIPAAAAEHDAAVARISHLPHVLAAVLAAAGADGGPLALGLGAGSFADGTRVAGSPPDLVRAMCEGNRAALLDAVDDALGRLGAARGSLATTGSLAATVQAGHRARRAFETAREVAADGTMQVDLGSATALERLRELGRLGGRVLALDGTAARVAV